MGPTLNTAAGMDAYALTDRGTWLSFENRQNLEIMVEGDPRLFNQYGIILVNPAKHPHVKAELGQIFIDWVVSDHGQEAIGAFKINGQQAFFPGRLELTGAEPEGDDAWLFDHQPGAAGRASRVGPQGHAARTVTDSAGRQVEVPDRIERVFAAGPPASVLLYVLRRTAWPAGSVPHPEDLPYIAPEYRTCRCSARSPVATRSISRCCCKTKPT